MRASEERTRKMMSLVSACGIIVSDNSDEADNLAATCQQKGILPPESIVDAQHIAIATVNDLDMIISLTFKHIVKRKTVTMTGHVNTELGYKPVEIHLPMEVVEREDP